jgi:recombination protein RecA
MDIRRIGAIKNGETVVGSRTRVKVVKNKVAPPFKEVEFDILYGTGISREGDLVDLASQENLIEKSGAWYSFNGERIGQGRENAKDFLRDHPEIAKELENRILEKFGLLKPSPVQAVEAAQETPEERRPRVKAVK